MIRHRGKIITYVTLASILLAGSAVVSVADWPGVNQPNRITETMGAMTALFVGVMAVVSFYTRRDVRTLTIGAGFLAVATMNAYQVITTLPIWSTAFPSMLDSLLARSWLASHLVVAVTFLLAWLLARRIDKEASRASEIAAYLGIAGLAVVTLLLFMLVPYPALGLPAPLAKMGEVTLAGVSFLVAMVAHLAGGRWKRDPLDHWLVMAMITGLLSQVGYMARSSARYDTMFDAANWLMIGCYGFVLVGLLAQMHARFRKASEDAEKALRANRELETEIKRRKQTEHALKNRTRELERSNEQLQEFAFVASHDLQAPLRKIRAFGERLESQLEDRLDDRARDYLDRMMASGRRMQQLLDSLLAYSRVSSKGRPFERVDLNEAAHDAVSDLEVKLRESDGRVEIDDLPTIEADEAQMRQLLQNLIGNALKYSKTDKPPEVVIRAQRPEDVSGERTEGPRWRILIEDNGIGFEEKYVDRIFKVFQRLHGKGEYEGTGVGLSVCSRIVERHGGSITARSEPGEGSTFIITLPERQPRTESNKGNETNDV